MALPPTGPRTTNAQPVARPADQYVNPDAGFLGNATREQFTATEAKREEDLASTLRAGGLERGAKVQYNLGARALLVRLPNLSSGSGPTSKEALQSVLDQLSRHPDVHSWVDHMHVVRSGTRPAIWNRPGAAE